GVDGGDVEVVAATPSDLAPLAPPAGAAGSTWFCAGGTADADGFADHEVVIANTGDAGLTATMTVFGGALADDVEGRQAVAAREPVVEVLDIPARTRLEVRLGDLFPAPFASALIEVQGGEVVVEHVVRGEDDLDAAPCSSAAAASWFLAAGDTRLGARELVVLFNPFPDDAVVDVRFTTPEGQRSPPELEGFVVPARAVLAVDIGLVVSRHAQVSTSVVARAGRLVVDRLQLYTNGDEGLAVTPAAPSPALLWYFPEGLVDDGVSELVTVFNPGDVQAEVDVELVLAPTDDPTIVTAVEPFQLSIPPHQFAQVDLGAEDRVPPGLGHAVVVRSQNGNPVVAERWQRASSSRVGLGATLGSPVVATRWLLAAGGTPSGGDQTEFLVVLNPSPDTIARLTVTVPTGSQQLVPAGLEGVEVPEGGRVVLQLGRSINRDSLPLIIESTSPVVVERGIYRTDGGIAQSIAVPTEDTATVPDVDASAPPVG
nr:DUF5719 family protein [Actinomycetota bacterium]